MAETGNDFCRFRYSNATAKSKIKARAQTKPSGTTRPTPLTRLTLYCPAAALCAERLSSRVNIQPVYLLRIRPAKTIIWSKKVKNIAEISRLTGDINNNNNR